MASMRPSWRARLVSPASLGNRARLLQSAAAPLLGIWQAREHRMHGLVSRGPRRALSHTHSLALRSQIEPPGRGAADDDCCDASSELVQHVCTYVPRRAYDRSVHGRRRHAN
ncbi:hypothetical protein U9M48_021950 [Paspalum notatum var. saurae]|uniref:Uncharacterized protein n=1 Tax=Paspalum notatum var. saurae TaxID=547442 RepID=A0AAQ3TLT3_PASNO